MVRKIKLFDPLIDSLKSDVHTANRPHKEWLNFYKIIFQI